MKKISLSPGWLVLMVIGVLAFEAGRAMPTTTEPDQNYRLELLHRTAHTFNPGYDDGEESVRVEEVLMRTSTHPKIVRWRKELDQLRGKSPVEQLEAVNRIINGDVTYRSDYQHWKREDKWGFPFATLDEGGDCEDFAMLKRVSLHYLGWPQDGIFLLMGYSTMNGKPETHAVLLVKSPDDRQFILDSMERHVVAPAADHHFKPMMALDRDSIYMVRANQT
jgi:predicted transglutaminase-like cysteine proteinase